MALAVPQLILNLVDRYKYVTSLRDPRTVDWGWTENSKFMLPLALGYLYAVRFGGRRWMENRKPYKLKSAIMVYNLFQVIANTFLFVQYTRHSYLGGDYNAFCQGVSYSRDNNTMTILRLVWWSLFVRIADFLDTFFFVATKKFSHITALHVIHHFLVIVNGWLWITFGSDGHVIMPVCFNCLVHVIMYGYYFLASLGPAVRKHLWWKKYLTSLQIFQMTFVSLYMCIPLVYDCGYPWGLSLILAPQLMLVLALFINFYVQSYIFNKGREQCNSQALKSD
ncbi:elongation of very long chain fatty acids protein AAEL008004-like [Ixodes scapularis]|uniref:elongation of very long chain fatty acids protein AAEL008004-like n=1 Tax=Ixodes scapularis TaxID=6945 RepID=UPI001A9EF25D|nr:elongation of very long chain fatty acids protein AAEL008004-like [Ixodes scapularis]